MVDVMVEATQPATQPPVALAPRAGGARPSGPGAHPRPRRSPLRVGLAAVVAAAAAAVLALCLTGGAQSAADTSPSPVSSGAP